MSHLVPRAGLAAALAATLGLCACYGPRPHPGDRDTRAGRPMSVAAALTCPQNLGGLTRTAQAADGQSCAYDGWDGEQVGLRRVALAGQTPQAGLAPLESDLRPVIPARTGPTPVSVEAGQGQDADQTNVNLPGVKVRAGGDRAEVKVFGITVNAEGKDADVQVGPSAAHTLVQAGPEGAEIHIDDAIGGDFRRIFILASESAGPSGFRSAGYLARGPATGPLVAATFKSRESHEDWRRDHDLNALLDINVKQ